MKNQYSSELIVRWAVGPLTALSVLVVVSHGTAGADTPKACAEAYEKAQEERKAGRITAAIASLTKCAARGCPTFVSKDCLQWLSDAEKAQPRVVFAVRREGADLTSVEITMDGSVLTRSVDGKAIPLDPGFHVFRFRAADGSIGERSFLIREGDQNRIIEVELAGREPEAEPAPRVQAPMQSRSGGANDLPETRPTRSWLPYGLLGVGGLGLSGFAVFAVWGQSQKNHLEESCAPYCGSSQVDEAKTKYIVADACLAVGLVSLGVASYLWLRKPDESAKPASSAVFWPSLSRRSGAVDLAIRF